MNDNVLRGAPRSTARLIGVITAGLLATACGGSLFESSLPVATRYVISPPPAAAAPTSSPALHIDLAIGRPDVAPGLDNERIAVIRGHQLDYFRGALWAGTVLDTVQAFIVATFQDQKLFRSVAPEQARVSGDYLLDIEVRDFQAEYAAGVEIPTVRVTLVSRLIRIRDRKLMDVVSVTGSHAASANTMTEVAAAFQTVMQQVSLELSGKIAQLAGSDRETAKLSDR